MKLHHLLALTLAASLAGCLGPDAEVPPRPADLPRTYTTLVPPKSGHTPPRTPAERAALEEDLQRRAVTPR